MYWGTAQTDSSTAYKWNRSSLFSLLFKKYKYSPALCFRGRAILTVTVAVYSHSTGGDTHF